MKLIKLFIITWAFSVQAGLPPTTLSGDQQTLKPTTFTALTPNNQATQVLGVQSRIETGNTNLLANPSFEHATVTTGWTIANATGTANITEMVDGKKDLSLALSGALTTTQDSTINASNLVGLQGVASIKIKSSDVTGLQVCPRNAGVTVTALCANVVADGTWKNINIPFIMTATSNGIAIISSGTTGTVKIDDAFVGTSAPFQNVSGAKLVGTITITGCIGPWSVGSTSIASFGFQSSCVYTTTGAALAPSTQIPAIKFASLPAGDYRLEYEGLWGTISSAAITGTLQFWDGVNTARETSSALSGGGASTITVPGISQSINYSSTQSNVTLEIRGKSSASTLSVYGTTAQPGVIKVWYFPPESKIYSQASLDYDWTSYTPTWSGLSFSTHECFHKRKGSDLYLKCKSNTSASVVATEARMSLPSGLTSASTTLIPTIQHVGTWTRSNAGASEYDIVLIEPSVSYITFGKSSGASNMQSKLVGTNLVGAGENVTVFAGPIPVSGWTDYGVIVGSFAGIEKCANDYECTDTFSAKISATGVVSSENLDWINGNCTLSNIAQFDCPLLSTIKDGVSALTSTMNCTATANSAAFDWYTISYDYANSSTTSARIRMAQGNTGAANAYTGFTLKCQKGSSDYKPKTAKVASSIGVPTVPGVTSSAIKTFSATISTTSGAVSNQIGNVISSCTAANPTVCTLSGLIATPNCTAQCSNNSSGCGIGIGSKSSTAITLNSFVTNTGAALASQLFDLNCIGL